MPSAALPVSQPCLCQKARVLAECCLCYCREVRGDAQGVGPLVDMLGPEQDPQNRAYAARSLASMALPDRPAMGHAMLQLGAPEVTCCL